MPQITARSQREFSTDKAGMMRLSDHGLRPQPATVHQTLGPHFQHIIWHVPKDRHGASLPKLRRPYCVPGASAEQIARAIG